MRKTLALAVALLSSFAALAQVPTAKVAAPKPATERHSDAKTKQHDADDDHSSDQKAAPANHGQTVQAVAQSTPLTGADKGATMSAVARGGRGIDHATRSARGAHSHASGHMGSGHIANTHAGTHAHGH